MILMPMNATFKTHTSHISQYSHGHQARGMTADRVQSAQSSVRRFVRGNKDPAQMTHAKIAPVKRDLGAKRVHAKSQSA